MVSSFSICNFLILLRNKCILFRSGSLRLLFIINHFQWSFPWTDLDLLRQCQWQSAKTLPMRSAPIADHLLQFFGERLQSDVTSGIHLCVIPSKRFVWNWNWFCFARQFNRKSSKTIASPLGRPFMRARPKVKLWERIWARFSIPYKKNELQNWTRRIRQARFVLRKSLGP